MKNALQITVVIFLAVLGAFLLDSNRLPLWRYGIGTLVVGWCYVGFMDLLSKLRAATR